MNYNKTLALVPAILLAACGGDQQQINNDASSPGSVVYSFPADGQSTVSPEADIVLRFSDAITDEAPESKIQLTNDQGPVAYTLTTTDGGKSLILSPDAPLSLGSDFNISFSEPLDAGSRPIGTPNAVGADGIQFSTRAGFTGIQSLDSLQSGFAVTNMIPSADGFFKPMDFSSFRLTLSQPVHPDWKAMGGSIRLLDSQGSEVASDVYVDGRYLTLDPCIAETRDACGMPGDILTPGETYTLDIGALPSLSGETLDYSAQFSPKDTSPTVILYQETIDSGLLAGTEPQRSVLNGQIINGVSLNSVLQGTTDVSQQTGALYAELAYGPSFPGDEPVPLRVPKGSLLESSSLDVKVNGTVPVLDPATGTIQKTGAIKVTMLTDATGYLYPNPYSDSAEAPRHVKLFMDVSMNTEAPQPNASLSQNLMHVELSGIAIVKEGVLTIDAIGMVEPNLLGQETTDATIAFRIEADTNADVQLDALENRTSDTTGPALVSWMPGPDTAVPGDRDQMQRPGDPIVLNFDEPLDPKSLDSAFTLFQGNTSVDFKTKLDGTVVALNQVGGLVHGVEYTLNISSGLTDLAGNGATQQALTFALPALTDGSEAAPVSPFALTTYPGYPCVTTGQDIAAGQHGTCVDAATNNPVRDQIPVMSMPEDRPIVVKFSQSMDLATINNQSLVVEAIADPSSPGNVGSEAPVAGRIEKNNQQIRFYPDSAWEIGTTYRYTMRSAQNGDCNSGSIICSEEGLPLQTDLLVDPSDIGGPDLSIYFVGAEQQESVFTPLRNLPIRDTNSNYVIDCDAADSTNCLEPFDHEIVNGEILPSANSSKLTVVNGQSSAGAARVGCSPDNGDCPANKFIYQTYGLDTEVIGPATNEAGEVIGVRVLLYPTMLTTTSAQVVVSADLLFGADINSNTGTQILRMTYGEPTADNPMGLVEGRIVEGANGGPVFQTVANLTLDAPNLDGVTSHDLYSKPLTLNLEGPITFFDDGRMQIEQRNTVAEDITVNAVSFGIVPVEIPLRIPAEGTYLNFLSNPIKEIPASQ